MVEEAIGFWWKNQDTYTQMSRQIGFLLAKVDQVESELAPVNRRRALEEHAQKLILAAFLNGAHLNEEDLILLDEFVAHQLRRLEAPVAVPDGVTNPPRLALAEGGGRN